ncbi:MAG: choice-of-anchor A family protein [Melioribacter sp.]|nr:choice-of-anchor A family protein [Melioribacter sp.]
MKSFSLLFKILLIVMILDVVFNFYSFAQSKGIKQVSNYTSIAKVSGTAEGTTVTYLNPYTNQYTSNFAGTFKGTLNSQSIKFYCIDLQQSIVYNQDYWDEDYTPSQITYILNNYYPYKNSYAGQLSDIDKEAAAIQLAIWHFSDGLNANTITNSTIKSRALAIIADANANHNNQAPLQTLLIIPSSQSLLQNTPASFDIYTYDANGNPVKGVALQISTTLGTLSATTGVTDVNGHFGPITLTYNGVGIATISVKANVIIPQGTKYVHKIKPSEKQKLVLATPSSDTKEEYAKVEWYAPLSCDLKGYVTYTQGGWGSPSNSAPGKIRDLYFNSVFPGGMTVGGNYKITFTSANAIKNYLPDGGTLSVLTQNYTNPTSKISVLAGQLTALKLNVYYSAAGYLGTNATPLGNLVIVNGPFAGYSVYQFLTFAEQVLGGGSLNGFTLSQINETATAINENFDNGKVDKGYLTCLQKASIGDRVWEDLNKNGIQDAGELGLANITVKLFDCNGNLISTTTTNSQGYYLFSNLNPGDYYLQFIPPTGYIFTSQDSGGDDNKDSDANINTGKTICTTLLSGENDMSWDAGLYKETVCKNKIGDFVWHDKNVNGIQDSNEPGIKGVIVELWQNNQLIATDTTDLNGRYEFNNLLNGTYQIKLASSNFSTGGVLESKANTKWYSTKKNQGNNDDKDSDANYTETVTVNLNCSDNFSIDFGFYKTCVNVIKTSDKQKAKPGDVITYTFTVENCGDITLSGGVDFYDALLNPSGDHKIKNITPVLPGETKSFTKTYTVTKNDCGQLVNTVKAVGHPIDGSATVEAEAFATVNVECELSCVTDWTAEIGPDSAICEYDPKLITITGSVHLTPNPSKAYLQLAWRIVYPNDGSVDNSTHYQTILITKDTTFTITAQWPGIRPHDQIVEIHYGVNVLDCNGNPIKNGIGRDLYWYPWVCPPPQEEPAEVRIEKSVDNQNPKCGESITFTIKVTNDGPNKAKGIQVTDLLPEGLVYNSSSTSQGVYDFNTGIWIVGDLNSHSFATLTINAKVDCEQLNSSIFDLGPAKDYNLFVINDVNQPSSDTQGKVAVGRDAYFANYSIGDQLPPNSGDVLIVGRDLIFISGHVNGNVVYGNTTNLPQSSVSINGTLRQDSPINFAAAKTYLENLSMTLSNYTVNGTVNFQYGGLTLTGTDPFLNVFKVNGANLSSANNVTINAPNGSVVLVNIDGYNVNWTGGLTVNGTSITNVLYNFYEATQLTIQGIDIRGSLLAPFADVNFVSGMINGQLICKSLSGMGQMNLAPFIGNIPFEKELTNIATITSVLTVDPNPNNNSSSTTITVSNVEENNEGNNSENQNNWQLVSGFSSGEIVYAMAYDQYGNIYSGTWGGNIYKSSNGGQSWIKINNNMNVGFIWALNVHNGFIFAATEQGVYRYDGSSWILTSLSNVDVHALASNGNSIYAGVWGGGVYVSTDNGITWNEMNNGLGYNLVINSLTFHSNTLFAASYGGGVFKYENSTWTKLNVGYDFVWTIASNSSGLYAGTYGDGLYRSLDNGNTWSKVTALNAPFIYSIAVNLSNKVYVASWTSGVFESVDNGNTWNSIGMGGFGVSSIIISKNDNNVYVGTKEGKIYLSKRIAGVTSLESEEIPTKFELYQNYPNPFNPITTIKFAVPQSGKYSLRVYDILGQEVATLFDGEMNPGTQKVTFNGNNLSSGVYIYRLIGNNVNITKKMILMK